MDHKDLGQFGLSIFSVLTAGFVLVGTFFNLLQSSIQIIGVGTAISLSIGAVKFYNDDKQSRRRNIIETVQRLQPKIYDPLIAWATLTSKQLSQTPEYEIKQPVGNPPDLTAVGDYVAIVGDTLQKQYQKIKSLYDDYLKNYWSVRRAYSEKIRLLTGSDPNYVHLSIGKGNYSRAFEAPQNYSIDELRLAAGGNEESVSLNDISGTETKSVHSKEIGRAILYPEDLLEFIEYKKARDVLSESIMNLINELTEIMRKGEKDWNI